MRFSVVCSADDRAQWLSARRTGIGASEMPALLGHHEWATPLSLWTEKRSEEPPEEREVAEHIRLGSLLEPVVVAEVARRAGVSLLPGPQQLLRSKEYQWATATPDAMTDAGEPVEVKVLSSGYDPDEWSRSIPERYLIQVQQQMLVTGADRALFGALVWGREIVWEWVERDWFTILRIIAAGKRFWKCVEDGVEPEPTASPRDRAILGARVDMSGDAVELSGERVASLLERYESAAKELSRLRQQLRGVEEVQGEALAGLALELGSAPVGVSPGGVRVEWRETHRRGYSVEPSTSRALKVSLPKK